MKSANWVEETTDRIRTEILLLVEGHDEYWLLTQLVQHWFSAEQDKFQIENCGGRSLMQPRFRTSVRVRSKERLQVIGVVADAEASRLATEQSWQDAFAMHAATGLVFEKLILPHDQDSGCVETVVLRTLVQDELAKCAEQFAACVAQKRPLDTVECGKLTLQAWLNATMGDAYRNIHKAVQDDRATQKITINFDDQAFKPIKEFLEKLLKKCSKKS